ncbi:cadmium-translocating P-type ATPase [Bacillus sp. HNG]|uniref:heavy metal translocating P-type ATPase n=1 Tax=Bacillus sp. HNG TaxID=2293325 RepID=UPI000E2EA903|nr:heavy metal translocating P-type ATPase [Bacillus sp. HNG]RFB13450.1 cadmium-translocating P-type ATPase [Bacillus sp. HNG]
MSTEVKTASGQQLYKTEKEPSPFLEKVKLHGELIAALTSGVLIAIAWTLGHFEQNTTSIVMYLLAFIIGGYAKAKEGITDTIAEKELNVEMLMIFAAIGSAVIGYWNEGAILIFIFALSGALETYTMNKSHKEISSLMGMQPDEATLIQNGIERVVHVSSLQIGDTILVKPGERIPADGKLLKGDTNVDQAAITGESIPVQKSLGDEVFAGTVNLRGSITVEVTKPNEDSLFQKIINLVQSAQSEKSPSQLFIEKFEGKYVKIVLIAVGFMMFLPHFLLDWTWTETFYRAMVLLVVASPCALVASIMPATLSAISNGARRGILFKGGVHLEQLGNLKAIALDKTGTLTKGKPVVTDIIVADSIEQTEFLQVVASIENQSTHPLAGAIVAHAKSNGQELLSVDGIEDMPGYGVKATVGNANWFIGKADLVGKEAAAAFKNGVAKQLASEGKTIVYVKSGDDIAGILALKDVVRDDTVSAISALQDLGIYTVMLTGDGEKTAEAISKESHVDQYIAECLPETKVDHIKDLISKYDTVAMVGDGINDAPALATANVGIAMGQGTDVALETADVILMKNDLPRIAEAVKLSKRMNRIIKQNVIFSIAVIMLLIVSNFFQIIDLPFGVIGHEGSTILVILNGLRLLKS